MTPVGSKPWQTSSTAETLAESAQLLTHTGPTNSHPVSANSTIAKSLNEGSLPDVHLIGHTLFTQYNFPLQMLGVLLLVATVGVVTLSKKKTT